MFTHPLMFVFRFSCILLLVWATACGGSRSISEKGLRFARLGTPMPEAGIKHIKGHAVRDTLFQEGGYTWRAAILHYGDGPVYLESDFLGEGIVNRIRVESPRLHVGKRLRVGMKRTDLQAWADDWDILYLADYGLLDLVSLKASRIHYLLQDPHFSPEGQNEPLRMSDISDEAHIVAIVVM